MMPDTKDWTWAIREPCPDCGFDPRVVEHDEVAPRAVRYAGVLRRALAEDGATERPRPEVWSALEYAGHVRDVCRIFRHRLGRMLDEDDPVFDNWDQDATAVEQRYGEQDPAVVAAELKRAAADIAEAFAGVTEGQWERPGRRSNGTVFTVDTFARYFLHDLAHHSWDVSGEPVR